MKPAETDLLEGIAAGLRPPSEDEFNRVTAKWLFGRGADMMMRYAPWSFVLLKLMWKEGEAPWER